MIDAKGFRAGVGMIITNDHQQVLLAKRIGQSAWQFPQGGLHADESPVEGMYRELHEETGLHPEDVQVLAETRRWLYYRLPRNLIRRHQVPLCLGQKQKWFLLRLTGDEARIAFNSTDKPEFDAWRWAPYWSPLKEVIAFKHKVYKMALKEFAPLVLEEQQKRRLWPR